MGETFESSIKMIQKPPQGFSVSGRGQTQVEMQTTREETDDYLTNYSEMIRSIASSLWFDLLLMILHDERICERT